MQTAFENGFEKQAAGFMGTIVGGASRMIRGVGMAGMAAGKRLNTAGMGMATNPAGNKFTQGLGRGMMGAGNFARQGGALVAKNPGIAAGVAGAGIGGTALAAGMSGNNKQASAFEAGFAKQAGIIGKGIKAIEEHGMHPAELAGLGVLAVPAVKNLTTGKPMSEEAKDAYDVAGLGILAAPSLAHYAGKLIKH
jgi:hypothetical protein